MGGHAIEVDCETRSSAVFTPSHEVNRLCSASCHRHGPQNKRASGSESKNKPFLFMSGLSQLLSYSYRKLTDRREEEEGPKYNPQDDDGV